MSKPFWESKTFWAYIIAAAVIGAQAIQGEAWIPPGLQGIIGVGIGVGLRFITAQGVSLKR